MVLLATSLGQGLIIVLFGSVLAWGVGNAVSYVWDERRRRRESDLAALATFYQVYGEFFATWKLWNAHKRSERKGSEGELVSLVSPADVQWRLLERAGAAEGGFEALLVKLVSERRLYERDRKLLGCFREAYQMLREAIRDNKSLEWRASRKGKGLAFEQYRAFKSLAEYVAFRLKEPSPRPPLAARGKSVRARLASTAVTTPTQEHDAIEALLDITHHADFYGQWWKIATEELDLPCSRG